MIREVNLEKVSPKIEQNVLKSKPSIQTIKPSIAAPPAAGLPADKLSSSIVSFARFFSLPLKPQLLADIRQQAFLPQGAQAAPTDAALAAKSFADAKVREVLSLAAAAAESKGVELQPKGLESYAEVVDPDSRRHDEDRQRRRRKREQEVESITADNLKKMAFEYSGINQLVDILNKLPGKNGQRWIVLPFDFFKDDREIKVSMRILLDEEKSANRAVCMALDIAEYKEQITNNKEFNKRWLFVMEAANDKPMRLFVYVQAELSLKEQSQLKQELSQLLEIPIDRISVKHSEENFPHEASYAERFTSVDEVA